MYRDFSLCREITLLYKQGYHCTDRWGRAHLTCGFSHCILAFFNNATFFSELANLKSMTFLQKHLNIFNITYTVNCFFLGLYTDTDLSPMALLYAVHIIMNHLLRSYISPCSPFRPNQDLTGHWGVLLLGKKPCSSIQDSPGKKKMKQFLKYKRQALITLWSENTWNRFFSCTKKARFLGIKTSQLVLGNLTPLKYWMMLCTS